MVEGFICKNGILCGYIRKYGLRSRANSEFVPNAVKTEKLVYFGFHEGQNGYPIGPIYKLLFGNSVIISEHGSFSGNDLAYIYQNANFAIKGSFDGNSNLINGQKVLIEKQVCNNYGMKILFYSKPIEPFTSYHYNPPKKLSFGDQPNVPDEVAAEYLVMRDSPDALVGIHNMHGIVLKICEAFRCRTLGLGTFWLLALEQKILIIILVSEDSNGPPWADLCCSAWFVLVCMSVGNYFGYMIEFDMFGLPVGCFKKKISLFQFCPSLL